MFCEDYSYQEVAGVSMNRRAHAWHRALGWRKVLLVGAFMAPSEQFLRFLCFCQATLTYIPFLVICLICSIYIYISIEFN